MAEEKKKERKIKISEKNKRIIRRVAGIGMLSIGSFMLGQMYDQINVGFGLLKVHDDGILKFFDGDREISVNEATALMQKKYKK